MTLQEKLGKGEFNKATTKVLHFKRNPEALAVETAEQNRFIKLEAENTSLKVQLQKTEHPQPDAGSSNTSSVQSAVKDAEITVLQRQVGSQNTLCCNARGALHWQDGMLNDYAENQNQNSRTRTRTHFMHSRDVYCNFNSIKSLPSGITNVVILLQVADLEKAKTRLTQVFRAQVSSFREACYQMFGYQIDVAAEAAPVKSGKMAAASAVYTLKPQHADDDSARFQFRMTGSQQMEIVRSKFVQGCLRKELETFIDRSGLQGHQ